MSQESKYSVRDSLLFDIFGGNQDHLWVILAEIPPESPGEEVKYLIVNMTTRCSFSDSSCVLRPGERGMHPFVRNETVINYNGMQSATAEKLARLSRGRKLAPISPLLHERICAGAHLSKETPRKFKPFIPVKGP